MQLLQDANFTFGSNFGLQSAVSKGIIYLCGIKEILTEKQHIWLMPSITTGLGIDQKEKECSSS